MYEPTEVHIGKWNGRDIKHNVYIYPTEVMHSDVHGNWEGWDIFVESIIIVEGHIFQGSSGTCTVWAPSNEISKTTRNKIDNQLISNSIIDLKNQILADADGEGVQRLKQDLFKEEKRMRTAEWLCRKFIK